MQSAANATGRPSNSPTRAATGLRQYLGFGCPFGRPRCEARMTVAPLSSAYWMVGSDARTRVSSPIVPFLIGTLKSTRTKARLPARSRSVMLRATALQPLLDEEAQQIDAAARVAPLVVVPREEL